MTNKILITGGAGFIGSHIVDELLNIGHKVFVVDNLCSGTLENLPYSENLRFYQISIEDEHLKDIFEEVQPDYVIHLAAQTSVNFSISNPLQDAYTNIIGSINVIELCKKYSVKKLVAASSAAVYGTPLYLPIDEEHPTQPMSQYGLSKVTMEKYIMLSGIPYMIFRFSNAYGERQKSSKESGVVAIFDEAMKKNESVSIFGNGEQIRDFVYVKDIAHTCVKALEIDSFNEIINVSTNTGVTINQLFDNMSELYNYKLPKQFLPEREGDIRNSILSNQKYVSIFGSLNSVDLIDGLRKLHNYSMNH